jgi:hypothetical protein
MGMRIIRRQGAMLRRQLYKQILTADHADFTDGVRGK